MNTITPLTSIQPLASSTDRHGGQQQNFGQKVIGEILKATVLEARANNQFILDFSGSSIPVSSRARLSVGQILTLQVSQTTPQVELKIVGGSGSLLAGKSLVLLGSNLDLGSLLSSLQLGNPSALSTLTSPSAATLNSFLPAELTALIGGRDGGSFLQQLFNRLGINFENLLAQGNSAEARNSLKAALLEIASRFHNAEHLSEQANKLLSTLELFQLTQLQLTSQNLTIFPLPLPFVEQGYLLLDNNYNDTEESSEGDGNHKFSLYLTMSELGNIQINFLQNTEQLFIKLLFDSEEKVLFVSQYREMLEEMLSNDSRIAISFSSGADSPVNSLVRKLVPDGQSIINTTA